MNWIFMCILYFFGLVGCVLYFGGLSVFCSWKRGSGGDVTLELWDLTSGWREDAVGSIHRYLINRMI